MIRGRAGTRKFRELTNSQFIVSPLKRSFVLFVFVIVLSTKLVW